MDSLRSIVSCVLRFGPALKISSTKVTQSMKIQTSLHHLDECARAKDSEIENARRFASKAAPMALTCEIAEARVSTNSYGFYDIYLLADRT